MTNQPPETDPPKPRLVTATGSHPAVVIRAASRLEVLAGLFLDVVVLVCLTVLMSLRIISPGEGLPWMALLMGVKGANSLRNRKGGGSSKGAVLSILGIGMRG